jgi:hypothetical protein
MRIASRVSEGRSPWDENVACEGQVIWSGKSIESGKGGEKAELFVIWRVLPL